MSDWKNRLQKTIGINTAIMKAEQTNHLNSRMVNDLEGKNRTLHECSYYAHNALSKFISELNEDPETMIYADKTIERLEIILKHMETILTESIPVPQKNLVIE